MNEYYYAQIDANDMVTAVTQTAGPIDSPNMIRIDGLLPVGGKKYDRVASKKTPTFVDIPQDPTPVVDLGTKITVGSFFDRFGEHKYPILADQNPMVQALIKDVSVRKYVDLADPQLPTGLGLLVQAGHAIDPQKILTDPVTENEQYR